MKKIFFVLLLILININLFGKNNSFPQIPDYLCGINQNNVYTTKDFKKDEPWHLTDADIKTFKSIGVNTIRVIIIPACIGIDERYNQYPNVRIEEGRIYLDAGTKFNTEEANAIPLNWSQLDAFMDQLIENGITPYINPFTNHWMTIYIPEDKAAVEWYTLKIAQHITEKYGDNVIYGYFENIWKNSHEPWWKGEYRHIKSPLFKADFQKKLIEIYDNDINKLNKNWKSNYNNFYEIDIPDMGSVNRGVPKSALYSRRTYDLRYIIDMLSREAIIDIKNKVKKIAPNSIWVGACFHDGFGGLGQVNGGNPPNCNWSLRTHSLTSDIVAADNYQQKAGYFAGYRTVAKISSEENKSFIAAELDGLSKNNINMFKSVGGPNKGALIWSGKDFLTDFGIMNPDGSLRENAYTAQKLFEYLQKNKQNNAVYKKGKIFIYYPEETYEYMVCWENYLSSYISIFDYIENPLDIEPVTTQELKKLPKNTQIYVYEKYLPQTAINELNSRGANILTPHTSFVNENGDEIKRTYIPKDFYGDLEKSNYGKLLKNSFMDVEDKAFNIAKQELSAKITTNSQLSDIVIDGLRHNITEDLIDGDLIVSRIMFADKKQKEYLIVELPENRDIYGAFIVTYSKDKGRIPNKIDILISDDNIKYKKIYSHNKKITNDKVQIRFKSRNARFIKLDLGYCIDNTGTRLMEIGLLAHK